MAARLALAQVRREVFADDLPIAAAVDQLCRDAGLPWRDRLLTPLVTLRLFVLQVLHGNTSIAHLRQLCGVDFAPSSYCQARQRLPLEVIRGLLATMLRWAGHSADAVGLLGQRVLICDASSHSTSDTPQLRKRFGLPPGTKPGIGYPVAKVMGLMDAATGLFAALIGVPLFTHDVRHVLQLHPMLRSGDILLGDRAYCTYAHLALLQLQGVFGCFRLHQRRKCPLGQSFSDLPRLLQPNNRGICRFLRFCILACGLSQLIAGLRHVENVVNDLERKANIVTKIGQRFQLGRRAIGAHSAEPNRTTEQGRGLPFVNVLKFFGRDFLSFAFEIRHLPGDQLKRPRRRGQFQYDLMMSVSRPTLAFCRQFECSRQQRITGQNGDAFAKDFVVG